MLYQYTQEGLVPLVVKTSADHVCTVDGGTVSGALDTLNAAVAGKAAVKRFTVTLDKASWSEAAPYTQTVNISDMTADMEPICDLVITTDEKAADEAQAWACVGRVVAGEGTLTAYCYEDKPETDISLRLMVVL